MNMDKPKFLIKEFLNNIQIIRSTSFYIGEECRIPKFIKDCTG